MGYNNFYGDIPQWITQLIKLQVLDVSNNNFSGKMPSNLERLKGFKILASSQVSSNTLYDDLRIVIKGMNILLHM